MSPLRVHHVGLWVADLERMRRFVYVDALGGTSESRRREPGEGSGIPFVLRWVRAIASWS